MLPAIGPGCAAATTCAAKSCAACTHSAKDFAHFSQHCSTVQVHAFAHAHPQVWVVVCSSGWERHSKPRCNGVTQLQGSKGIQCACRE